MSTMFCRKNFGPKGYGFGGGAGTLSMDDGKGYASSPNQADQTAKAHVAPKKPLVPHTSSNVTGALGTGADVHIGFVNSDEHIFDT
jgi:hypothetical protein